jgi:hypothetical protein
MRRNLKILVTAVICLHAQVFAITEMPPAKPSDPAGWSALALADVDGMHALLRDHTPIPFDKENPAYALWLEEGHDAARARAATVTNEAGYIYTLTSYANGFHDPHISVKVNRPPAIRWPGFIAVARGDELVVTERDESDHHAPGIGTIIESCDGQAPSALAQSRVAPFTRAAGVPERWNLPDLFLDLQNPFVPLIASCTVRNTDGEVVDIDLHWRRIRGVSSTFGADLSAAVFGPSATWGLTEPSPGVFWIGIPTFQHIEREQLRMLVESVKAREKEMRNARAIVIDTRGNFGGTTIWANKLAEAIFTPRVLSAAEPRQERERRVASELRSSPENITYLRNFVAGLQGSDVDTARRTFNLRLKEIERAARRSPPIAKVGNKKTTRAGGMTTLRPHDATSPFPAQVYFLSNGSCASTCLIFADKVLMVPGVQLIGSATSGDALYGEVRSQKLPSGLTDMVFPQGVDRGRGRGALETYQPDISYNGSWDDSSVRAWVLSLIEGS